MSGRGAARGGADATASGLFLHTPFPAPAVFMTDPAHADWSARCATSICLASRPKTIARAFTDYVLRQAGGSALDGGRLHAFDRTVKTGVYPIGVHVDEVRAEAEAPANQRHASRLRASLLGRPLILSVDRLDYSKGLRPALHRLRAVPRSGFRSARATWCSCRSRRRRAAISQTYREIRRELEAEAGRINGRFAEVDWMPLRYLNRSFARSALMPLYAEAQVGLVTPLRDGMNLVAKEYVAAQDPDDPGVLVLSQFAGAARELDAALIVNPYDEAGIAAALDRALAMALRGAARAARRHDGGDAAEQPGCVARSLRGGFAGLTPEPIISPEFRQERSLMGISIDPVHPVFAGEVSGIDITRPLTRDEVAAIEAGMDRYAVLAFPRPAADRRAAVRVQPQLRRAGGDAGRPDEQAGGPPARRPAGTRRYFQSRPRATGCARATTRSGCMRWPTGCGTPTRRSVRIGAGYTLLHSRVVPGKGGNTEFADMRAAYDALDAATKAEIEDLVCEHSIVFSREQIGFAVTTPTGNEDKLRPVRHRLVITHPVTGRKSLYLSSHIGGIVGWPVPEARAFIRDLTEHATQPAVRLRARMAGERPGDVGQPHGDAPRAPLRRPERGARPAPHLDQGHRADGRAGPGGLTLGLYVPHQPDRLRASIRVRISVRPNSETPL